MKMNQTMWKLLLLVVVGVGQAGCQPVARSTAEPENREMSHYLAGIAAYEKDQLDAAERHLRIAAQSPDASLSADAYSTLGLIYSRSGRYSQAADAFLRGADQQSGEDRAQAYFYAGTAQQKLGRWPQARTSLVLARRSTNDPALVSRIDQQLAVTGYTLQVGAFANPGNAQKLADRYSQRAATLKLGSVYVTPATDARGRAIQLVQVGRYATFGAAMAARAQLGDKDAVVVPLKR